MIRRSFKRYTALGIGLSPETRRGQPKQHRRERNRISRIGQFSCIHDVHDFFISLPNPKFENLALLGKRLPPFAPPQQCSSDRSATIRELRTIA